MLSKYIIVTVLLGFFAVTVFAEIRDVVDKCDDLCRWVSTFMCRKDKYKILCSREDRVLTRRYCTVKCLIGELHDSEHEFEEERPDKNAKVEELADSLLYSQRLVSYPFHISEASYVRESKPDDEETVVIIGGTNPFSRKGRVKREFSSNSFNVGGAIGGSIGGDISIGPEGVIKKGMATGFTTGYGNKDKLIITDDGTKYEDFIEASGTAAGAGTIYGDSMHPNYDVNYSHGAAGEIKAQTTAENNGQQLYGAVAALEGGYITKGVGVIGQNPNTSLPLLSTLSKTYGAAKAVGVSQIGNVIGGYLAGKAETEGLSRYNVGLGYGPSGFGLQGQGRNIFDTVGQLDVHGGAGRYYPNIPLRRFY